MGDSEIAEDSFYYVPPVKRDDGTVWAKMGHGKELEQTLSPSTSAEVIDRWYEHGDAAHDDRCLEVIESQFRQFFPNVCILEATLNRNGVTMDTDDGRVACRMLGEDGAVAVCAGCNGGGAKLSDEVGRLCAEMVLEALGKKKRAPSRKPKPKSWWHTEDPYYDDTESPQIGCAVG
jgi:sarcosine oxidase